MQTQQKQLISILALGALAVSGCSAGTSSEVEANSTGSRAPITQLAGDRPHQPTLFAGATTPEDTLPPPLLPEPPGLANNGPAGTDDPIDPPPEPPGPVDNGPASTDDPIDPPPEPPGPVDSETTVTTIAQGERLELVEAGPIVPFETAKPQPEAPVRVDADKPAPLEQVAPCSLDDEVPLVVAERTTIYGDWNGDGIGDSATSYWDGGIQGVVVETTGKGSSQTAFYASGLGLMEVRGIADFDLDGRHEIVFRARDTPKGVAFGVIGTDNFGCAFEFKWTNGPLRLEVRPDAVQGWGISCIGEGQDLKYVWTNSSQVGPEHFVIQREIVRTGPTSLQPDFDNQTEFVLHENDEDVSHLNAATCINRDFGL